jgi:hypothetical protein
MALLTNYRAIVGLWTGLAAGTIYLLVEMALVAVMGGSPWQAIRAIGFGKSPSFELGVLIFALFFHFIRAIASAMVLTAFTHRLSLGVAIPVGAIAGAAFYGAIAAFYGTTGKFSQAPFPEDAGRSVAVLLTTYVIFGIACSVLYNVFQRGVKVP